MALPTDPTTARAPAATRAEAPLSSPFAAPVHELAAPRIDVGALLSFAIQRLMRMAVAVAVVATLVTWMLGARPSWLGYLAIGGIGVALYLPTTAVLFRARFFPRDPEADELVLADGTRVNAGDWLAVSHASAIEQALAGLPLCLLAAYAVVHAGIVGVLVGALSVGFAGWTALVGSVDAAIATSSVRLNRDEIGRAALPLDLLLRLPLPARLADPLRHQLALVRFRAGRVDELAPLLDRIRDREGVALLGAQALVGRDPGPARALLASRTLRPEEDEALSALVALHDGRPAEVVAHRSAWEDQRPTTPTHQARYRDLLLAAAIADQDPELGRQLLRRSRWRVGQLDWIRTVWPAIGGAITPLAPW